MRHFFACLVTITSICLLSCGVLNAQTAADADFNNSGNVDLGDFVLFAAAFGATNVQGSDARFDLDSDGNVNFDDFVIFAGLFGRDAPPEEGQTIVLEGEITSDQTLRSVNTYILRSLVTVASGATLIIEPGTVILGERATRGTLLIDQGGKIMANGTADRPIVFTSENPEGQRDRGQWGGLIINGYAPINTGDTAEGEGNTGRYGGSDPEDDSGVLRYVRVEFAGIEFSPDNELNGIAFQGVGNKTVAEYLQVHYNLDDGVEFFGGTVNARYVLCTGIRDDSFDWTDGWVGKGQFWVAQQSGDEADQGIEADNDSDDNEATPRSSPQIYNLTLIGDPEGPTSDTGILLREGTAGTVANAIVTGFNKGGLDIDSESTFTQATNGDLKVQSSIFYGNKVKGMPDNFIADDDDVFNVADWARMADANNAEVNPLLEAPFSLSAPDFRPASGSPAVNGAVTVSQPPSDGFFEAVDFIGGMHPDNDWTAGWTTTEQPDDQ